MDYFDDDKAYLTQSGQLYNEATAMAFGKVYCFGPTFRAEKSKTRRHLTEFWMVEPEMAYATLEDVKRVAEEMIVFIVGRVLENRREELKRLERDVTKLEAIQAPFPRMSYDDAVKILQAKGSEIQWGGDFGGTDETMLTEDQTAAHHGGPLPGQLQGLLLPARSGASAKWRWAWTCWRRKATAKSSAAASASTIPNCC